MVRAYRLAVLLVLELIAASCSGDPVIPFNSEPLVYLVVNQRADVGKTRTRLQKAILTASGTPAYSPYLTADLFELERERDGGRYRFLRNGKQGGIEGLSSDLAEGNYDLPARGSAGWLGGDDITQGDRYDLAIQLDGMAIGGSVFIPADFSVQVTAFDSAYVLAWPHVLGAALYAVEGPGVTGGPVPGFRYQSDTTIVIALTPRGGTISVQALDSNVVAFLRIPSIRRAGLTAGTGVFGAVSEARVELPPTS